MQKYLCFFCSHYILDGCCFAYPNGIPEDIISGENDHSQIQIGQVGDYVFTHERMVDNDKA